MMMIVSSLGLGLSPRPHSTARNTKRRMPGRREGELRVGVVLEEEPRERVETGDGEMAGVTLQMSRKKKKRNARPKK